MVYDQNFIINIPSPEKWERRPLVNIKAHHYRLLGIFNQWYSELLPNGDPDLYARLRDVNNSLDFFGAFWELLVLRFLREEGHDVQRNVPFDGKTPDLYWPRHDIIGDVVAISDPHYGTSTQAHLDQLLGMLSREHLAFDIAISHFAFKQGRNPQLGRIVAWLRGLQNYHSADLYDEAQEYEDEDCNLEVILRPRQGTGGVKAVGMFSLDSEQLHKIIKARLQEKVRKYRRPLVVFAGTGLGHWPVNKDSLHMSLYGDWLVHFSRVPGREASGPDTACNGVFNNRKGSNGGPANTELSAVVLARWQTHDEKLIVHFSAYHNPEAIRTLPREFFSPMPQFVVMNESLHQCTLEWVGENEGFILGDPLPAVPTR